MSAAAKLGPTFDEPFYLNAGLTSWSQSLQQGMTDEQLVAALAGSQEYFNNI